MKDHSSAIQPRREAVGLILGAAGVLIFSFTLPATKAAVPVFGSWTVGIGRAVVAGGLGVILLRATRSPQPDRALRRQILVVAGGVVVGFPLLTALALQHVPASRGAILVGLLPAATAATAAIRHGERPSLRFWMAALVGLGAISIFAALTGADGRPEPADGLLLLAVAAAAIGYAEGGAVSAEIGGWQTISWALVYSLPATVPVTLVAIATTSAEMITTRSVIGLGYLSVFSMFLGFFAWYAGLSLGGTARVSQIQLLQPILTLGWAALFLGETVTVGAVAAAVVVVGAVAATRSAPVRQAGPRPQLVGVSVAGTTDQLSRSG